MIRDIAIRLYVQSLLPVGETIGVAPRLAAKDCIKFATDFVNGWQKAGPTVKAPMARSSG